MAGWELTAALLVAVLVGAAVPALLQLRATLRAVEDAVRKLGAQGERALDTVTSAAERADRIAATLEQGGRVAHLVESLDGLATAADRLRETARVSSAIGAAIAPAVAAAVRAWRAEDGAGPDGAELEPPAAPPPEPEKPEVRS